MKVNDYIAFLLEALQRIPKAFSREEAGMYNNIYVNFDFSDEIWS